jgi:hypothetical protein
MAVQARVDEHMPGGGGGKGRVEALLRVARAATG